MNNNGPSIYHTKQALQHQNMKLKTRLMERVCENSKYLLLNCQKVGLVELILEP
jgi:hypothetical protein